MYLLTSCNKEPSHFSVNVKVKDFYSQTSIEGISVNLSSRSRSIMGPGPFRTVNTQTTDQHGQTIFSDVPLHEGRKTHHLLVSESANYSKSEHFDLNENNEVSLRVHPLLLKKVNVFKPLIISSLNIQVQSNLLDNIQFTRDSSETFSHHFKFVTGIPNHITVSLFKGSVVLKDTIITLTPGLNDTSSIHLHL